MVGMLTQFQELVESFCQQVGHYKYKSSCDSSLSYEVELFRPIKDGLCSLKQLLQKQNLPLLLY